MKKSGISITAKSVFFICGVLLLANFILGSVLLSCSKSLIKTLINDRMLDIVNTSADMLDGDALAGINEESEGTPEFNKIFNTLKVFQDNINLEFIYTVRDMGDGTFIFTVDPAEKDAAEYGQLVKVTEALKTAAGGVPATDTIAYNDDWGKFYSAYSPVFDSKGNVSGVVCVDFGASWYDDQVGQYTVAIVVFSIFSLMIGAAVVFLITSGWHKRLRVLNKEMVELTRDVDELIQEMDASTGSSPEDTVSYSEDTTRSIDEVNEIGAKIRSMRNSLREHIDNMQTHANGMITAMASDYRSVYYIDLDKNEGICYRAHEHIDGGINEGERFCFSEVFTRYAEKYVVENDREEFLRIITPDNIRGELEKESIVAHRYIVNRNGKESYEMFRMAGVRHPEDRDDHYIHAIGVGFTDVDKETRDNMRQQQALSDALAVAEDASQAKTAFLSRMSHEIRTPMNAIIGLDSLALSDPEISEKTRDYLTKIGSAAQHLLGLINDILDMSRIESGKVVLQNEEFSMSNLLEQINTMMDSHCRDKAIKYECHVEGDIGDYYIGDAMKLKQVIINILGNSVKFTESGGNVDLYVKRTTRFDGKSTLRFIMSDTGIGMDKEFLPKIFDAYSQEKTSMHNKYGSTGLGMAITKNLVDIMNGNISVDSEKGKGTAFVVTVTLIESEHLAEEKDKGIDYSEYVGSESGEKVTLEGRRILLAEDMEINAEIMRELLDIRDIETDHAENGKIAVDKFASHPEGWYDAILMDMQMPEMNGLEATMEIRAMKRPDAKKIPIIALTANAFDEDVQRSLQAGLNAHLSKPVEPDILFSTLENLIQ